MRIVGVDTVLVVGACVATTALVLLLLFLAPWRSVRDERPLDTDTETRLLLGEDPTQVAADIDAAEHRQTPGEVAYDGGGAEAG